MRGKLTTDPSKRHCKRITPADAGKTIQQGIKNPPEQDHPRGCGENCVLRIVGCVATGSPPRMRGKLSVDKTALKKARITPADAGKTGASFACAERVRDHPRGCGENALAILAGWGWVGSPPRMRGKLDLHGGNE